MEAHGFKIDIEKLSQGVYQLCKEHPDNACMVLGMLPTEIINFLETDLKRKIPDRYIVAGDPLHECDGKTLRERIVHTVCSNILSYASKDGICIA